MLKNLLALSLFISYTPVFSAVSPQDLIKVTPQTKVNCVEYYNYQNAIYCSTKALNEKPVDPKLYENEKQHLQFDNRIWQPVWGKKDGIITIEYVPAGDNINNWHELLTTHFIPTLSQSMTIENYINDFIANLKQTGLNPTVSIHEKNPKEAIFEFKIATPPELRQDELQKVVKTDQGFYIIHYVIKTSDMNPATRAEWLKNLRASSIANEN